MKKKYYAHSLKDEAEEKWHPLEDHLMETAKKARSFTGNFDSGEWGYMGGKWHAQNGQDAHIKGEKTKRVIHSTAGALYALRKYGPKKGLPLAFIIAGHHAGLADKEDLKSRLDAQADLLDKALASKIPEDILTAKTLEAPAFLNNQRIKNN